MSYDLLIKNGTVVDGTDEPPRRADGSAKRGEMRDDLPGGGRRIVMPSDGIEHVIVNGAALYHEGKASGTLPGQVLRSGNCRRGCPSSPLRVKSHQHAAGRDIPSALHHSSRCRSVPPSLLPF